MVVGIEIFRAHFAGLEKHYVLIGGTACDILHELQGLEFRPTKDLDVVLCVETLDAVFMNAFWDFIGQGAYEVRQQGEARRLYRFIRPQSKGYPFSIELFSRKPDKIQVPEGVLFTPIPAGEDASSLSAIILDDGAYRFLMDEAKIEAGVRIATVQRLIPLKALAWSNLARTKFEDQTEESKRLKNIKKHHKDIYRLSRLLIPDELVPLPLSLEEPLREWLASSHQDPPKPNDPILFGIHSDVIHALIRGTFLAPPANGGQA